jgi:hypothetical protein
MEVDVSSFLTRIIVKTNLHDCSWEKIGPNSYRLLLKNGSVTIKKGEQSLIPNPLNPDLLYQLRLYDQSDCFYSLDVFSPSDSVYKRIDELFRSIRDEENRVINQKISLLMNDL